MVKMVKGATNDKSPKIRAAKEVLSYYSHWDCRDVGEFRWNYVFVLYPLVFTRQNSLNDLLDLDITHHLHTGILLERQDDNKNLSKEIFQSYTLGRDWDYFEKKVGMEREAKIDFLETMMSRYFDAVDKYQKESKDRKQGLIDNQLKEAGTNFTSYETVKCPACDHTHLFGENKEAYVQCEECEIDLVFTPSSLELLDPPFILEDFHEVDRNTPASPLLSEQHHAEHYVESPQRVSQGSQIPS